MTMGNSRVGRLSIHVADDCGKTVSKFGVEQEGVVEFFNDHETKILTISIESNPEKGTALYCGDQPIDTFMMAPSESRTLRISRTYMEKDFFKYTATLSGSEPEDPVIIIERR